MWRNKTQKYINFIDIEVMKVGKEFIVLLWGLAELLYLLQMCREIFSYERENYFRDN